MSNEKTGGLDPETERVRSIGELNEQSVEVADKTFTVSVDTNLKVGHIRA